MELNDKVKETINDLKSKAEKLKQHLELSTSDASKEFEIQKEKLQDWLDENDINSDKFKYKSEEAKKEIQTNLEELQVQLALGKAEGEEAIRNQAKVLNQKIHKLKTQLENDDKIQTFKQKTNTKLLELSDTFEILSLKFQYDIEEGKEIWEEKKKEINNEINQLTNELENIKSKSSEKINEFIDGTSTWWNNIKKTF